MSITFMRSSRRLWEDEGEWRMLYSTKEVKTISAQLGLWYRPREKEAGEKKFWHSSLAWHVGRHESGGEGEREGGGRRGNRKGSIIHII